MISSKKIVFSIFLILISSVIGVISYEAFLRNQELKTRSCPSGFCCFNDYFEGLAYAQKVDKPMLILFTGYATSDRKFQKVQIQNRKIKKLVQDNYVLITLYIDERKPTWDSKDWFNVECCGETRTIKSNGDKWFYFQYKNFRQVSQPWFVLLSPNEQLLNKPRGYFKGEYVQELYQFLKCGLAAHKSIK